MAYTNGAPGELWHANFKINTQERGFNLKFHLFGADYAAVTPKAVLLGQFLRPILPIDAEIFYATISNDNTKRDSRFLRNALGAGQFLESVGPDVPGMYDMPSTAALVRLENTEGDAVTRKINPIPDIVIKDAAAQSAIADVVGVPAAPVVPVAFLDWYANFVSLMKAIMVNTIYVKTGHAPGAAFQYATWLNAYYLRPGVKKGGRVFGS